MNIASAPGKLFIAGEYAVVETGYPAILVAVNQLITVELDKTFYQGSISSYGDTPILWTRENGKLFLSESKHRFEYILAAINTVEVYAKEKGRTLGFYNLNIVSELESDKGTKYGLGSSAAITVATIEALCEHYEIIISPEELFKLSALTHLSIDKMGSFGDIAACVYGGWIAFTTFSKSWVLAKQKINTITQLISIPWPGFSIESLTPPDDLRLVVGWTGVPARTENLVDRVYENRLKSEIVYQEFLNNSKKCVEKMIDAFRENNVNAIQKQININRELLKKMSNDLDVVIETPLLTELCNIASKFKGAAKSSGAGGGDCGIAILKDDNQLKQLVYEWGKSGITYLPLKVYKKKGDNIEYE